MLNARCWRSRSGAPRRYGSCYGAACPVTLNAHGGAASSPTQLRAGGRDFPVPPRGRLARAVPTSAACSRPSGQSVVWPRVPVVPGRRLRPRRDSGGDCPGRSARLRVPRGRVVGASVDEAAAVLALAERLGGGPACACAASSRSPARRLTAWRCAKVAVALLPRLWLERCGRVLRQAFVEVARHADFLS